MVATEGRHLTCSLGLGWVYGTRFEGCNSVKDEQGVGHGTGVGDGTGVRDKTDVENQTGMGMSQVWGMGEVWRMG